MLRAQGLAEGLGHIVFALDLYFFKAYNVYTNTLESPATLCRVCGPYPLRLLCFSR